MSTSSRDGFLLLHGIGHHPIDSIRDSFLNGLNGTETAVDRALVREVNWDHLTHKPEDDSDTFNKSFISDLGRAMLNGACIPLISVGTGRGWSRHLGKVTSFMVHALPLLPIPLVVAVFNYFFFSFPHMSAALSVGAIVASVAPVLLAVLTFSAPIILSTIRAVLLSIAWPVMYIIGLPVFFNWAAIIALSIFLTLRWNVWRFLDVSSLFIVEDTLLNRPSLLGMIAGLAVAFTALALGKLIWLGVVLVVRPRWGYGFKLLADVVRYIGLAEYRCALYNECDRQVSSLLTAGCDRIFLVTHSLGTIIAIDRLRRGGAYYDHCNFVLITSGSPLRRFFWRFIPAVYPEPIHVYGVLKARWNSFRWINIYRPHDPVGTTLGLPDNCEASTQQRELRCFSSHGDYWSDKRAHAVALKLLRHEMPRPVHSLSIGSELVAPSLPPPLPSADKVYRLRMVGASIVFGILFSLAIVPFVSLRSDLAAVPRLQASTHFAAGRAYYAIYESRSDGMSFVYRKWVWCLK